MELVITPKAPDLSYRALFKEPLFQFVMQSTRINLVSKILKEFKLRLNDIKFNQETLSNNFIHFSKFYGPTFFDVSFGLEEIEGSLKLAQDEAQVIDIYGKLASLFEQNLVSLQRMTIQRHLSIEGDSISYLRSLNPHASNKFKKFLHGTGVHYTLKISDHELTIYITLVESLFIKGGLFLSIDNEFLPNQYDFQEAFKIAKGYQDFILKELNLTIE